MAKMENLYRKYYDAWRPGLLGIDPYGSSRWIERMADDALPLNTEKPGYHEARAVCCRLLAACGEEACVRCREDTASPFACGRVCEVLEGLSFFQLLAAYEVLIPKGKGNNILSMAGLMRATDNWEDGPRFAYQLEVSGECARELGFLEILDALRDGVLLEDIVSEDSLRRLERRLSMENDVFGDYAAGAMLEGLDRLYESRRL